MTAPAPTLAEQAACLERELGIRRRIYPKWVGAGRITQDVADREIARMEAALATINGLRASEPILGGAG